MNSKGARDDVLDCAEQAKLTDEEYVAVHVPRYKAIRPNYEQYEKFLETVLKQACRKLAPLAVIETRTKGIPSFAEKILRKRSLYMDPRDPLPQDPLIRMTDLCGGRVIAQTSEQVNAVCRFLVQAFDIDERNSEDVSKRLKPTEFGYRSVHYIVTVDPKKLRAAGIDVSILKEVLDLKAEVQVRTLLEHASADIGHDLLYKTQAKVPDRLRRLSATLSAVLEEVDQSFARLVGAARDFKSNYGAYHTGKEVEAEIERLRIVLAYDPENTDLAVRIAQLALSIGKHDLALGILKPSIGTGHQGVERVLGIALTEMHWDEPQSPGYREGRESLAAACSHSERDAETLCALAESWVRDDEAKASELFHEAADVDASEPVTLSRYIEFEVRYVQSDAIIRLATPMIRNAMARCLKQIEARVNLPWAWASLAMFHLYVKEPFEALNAIAQVIDLCDPIEESSASVSGGCGEIGRPCAAGRALIRMDETLRRIAGIKEKLHGYEWCRRAVLIGLAVRLKNAEALSKLHALVSPQEGEGHLASTKSVVILSGACAPEMRGTVEAFKSRLLRACEGISFTLFCGGTRAGISGVAGDIAQQSKGGIRAFGYMPRLLPRGVEEDTEPSRFVQLFSSPGSDFTPLDPMQGWTDIIAAGVEPRRVKLLSYAGGRISRFECALALALGARVGVVEDKALPKERQFDEPDWREHQNLLRLPMDPMTLRAFLLIDELPAKRADFEKAAQKVHEEYVKSATPREPSLLPWKDLSENLKIGNYHQVAYAENILKTGGLGIRKITDPNKPLFDMKETLGEDGIRRMAEMEHGRWNVERLLLRWHPAETKDVAKKLSPYLVAWEELSPDIQKFDLDGMRTLPVKLREAGLEIYKLGSKG